MKTIRTYVVKPSLPLRLQPLEKLARNLWWCWNHSAIELFMRMDMELWEKTYHNPIGLLGNISQERLNELQADQSFLAHMDDVVHDLEDYLEQPRWYQEKHKGEPCQVAYFSAEFGIHESLPTYSGGLGVLAGDHVKSSSDLGIPLIAIGIMYREGYFQQYLNADGWQQELYPDNDFPNMPMSLVRDQNGAPLHISIDLPGRTVKAQVWNITVGRTPMYMMDTNIPENSLEDRNITDQLYGGDHEHRVKQEILLGIGGMRLLQALGINPKVYHMNEGHSAFLGLERIRMLMDEGLNYQEAKDMVIASNVFTTHTPVAAGNDVFDLNLVGRYFRTYWERFGISQEEFYGMARKNPYDPNEAFCMTVLALRLASGLNGVAELHGQTSRGMWKDVWPGLPENEIPIGHVTNGIHLRSWVSYDMHALFNRYLGPHWRERTYAKESWEAVERIPDSELWRTHERRRERLVSFARNRVRKQWENRGANRRELMVANDILDPEALTIGFARRFATYKRGALIMSDMERLKRLLGNPDRPMQIVFAGKAHPHDVQGKEVIQRIVKTAQADDVLRQRVVFLENYDLNVAHYLVQGVDVWLNNPRRPLEASGTSGMKVPVNGGLNCSVLDGWWPEAYGPDLDNGWAIGNGEEYEDTHYGDEVEAKALFHILENEIIPIFYDRGTDGLPRRWIRMMKNGMRSICPVFNTDRMLMEYMQKFYLSAAERMTSLNEDDRKILHELNQWRDLISKEWQQVKVVDVNRVGPEINRIGENLMVQASVFLAGLIPDQVIVEAYHGPMDSRGSIEGGQSQVLKFTGEFHEGVAQFKGELDLASTGNHGFAIRVRPFHPRMSRNFDPGFLVWG